MGLDITAISKIHPSKGCGTEYTLFPHPAFPDRADGIAAGTYEGSGKLGFRAGSYSGYSNWRNQLAVLAGYQSADAAWREKYGPFWELINFSDCEGFIGPKTSAKLADDFANHQSKADAIGGMFLEVYNDFRKAFETAKCGGVVIFA